MTRWAAHLDRILPTLFARFFDDRAGMLYSYAVPDRDSALPTAEEIAAGIPSAPGWGTGVEDCAMNAGILLAALGDAGRHDEAARVLQGIERLLAAARVPGFVPRGLLPDARSHYTNTSGDQTNMLVCGLSRYAGCRGTPAGARSLIAEMLHAIVSRLEADDFVLRHEDGTPASVGDLRRVTAGHSARLLSVLMAATAAGSDLHWRDVYEAMASEGDGARLRCITDLDAFPSGWGFYGPEQLQVQLRLLTEGEWDGARRRAYQAAMRSTAAFALGMSFPCQGHAPLYVPDTLAALGDSAHLPSPFAWVRYRPEILARSEDWGWRGDFTLDTPPNRSEAWALDFVLRWMGRRPAFCHERNCVRFPLTALHIILMAGDQAATARAAAECQRLFEVVDFRLCRWADTLVEAAAVCALLCRETP